MNESKTAPASEHDPEPAADQEIKINDWAEITITSPPELTESLANFLMEIGAKGVFEENGIDPGQIEAVLPSSRSIIKAYLPVDAPLKVHHAELTHYIGELAELFPNFERPAFTVTTIKDPGWAEVWKKYFKPFRINDSFVIKPTWESYTPSPGDTIIEIDPGMAFGTGQHATTRMCLKAIEEILTKEKSSNTAKVLDIGTGTGILGIACAKLGAAKVVAVDIDPLATEISRQNVSINGVEDRMEIIDGDIVRSAEMMGKFDLIVANITAEPLIEMRPHLISLLRSAPKSYMKTDSFLIVSGIIEQRIGQIEGAFFRDPLAVFRVLREKEWFCYVFRKLWEGEVL